MATLHLLHGYIGSGKTTFARTLERNLGAVRFTLDEWMVTLYGVDPPAEQYAEYDARVRTVMERQWTRLLTIGVDVVLDFGFWTRAGRDEMRAKATALGVPCVLYRLEVPEDVARARVRRRNDHVEQLFVADRTFDVLRIHFEALEPDEDHVRVPTA